MKKIIDMQNKYINLLLEISKIKDMEELNKKFVKVYTKYSKFCSKHKISDRNEELLDRYKNIFIFPSNPILHEIDNNTLNGIIDKLENIFSNQVVEGLTEKEASYLLKAVVKGVRDELGKDRNIENDSLAQRCGFAQGLSYFLLDKLRIKTTINNAINFPDSNTKHAFLTCFLPVKIDNKVIYKQYLIDTTYRQFFLTIRCNDGNFYSSDERFKYDASPHPGYYINRNLNSKKIATQLLENGFIELTNENAKMYGSAFSFSSISLYTPKKDISKIMSHTSSEYINSINDKNLQVSIDYSKEEMENWGYNLDLRKVGNLRHK